MGDRLGTLDVVGILLGSTLLFKVCVCVVNAFFGGVCLLRVVLKNNIATLKCSRMVSLSGCAFSLSLSLSTTA